MEENDQQGEVHQRRKRRGGKRNTAWKNKRRQEKDDPRGYDERSQQHLLPFCIALKG